MIRLKPNNSGREFSLRANAFWDAWSAIHSNCQHISSYGASGHRPDYVDFVDERMDRALAKIRPYLEVIARPRPIWTPPEATWMTPFFVANSALEGLMLLVGPPEGLFGVTEYLGSVAFIQLRADAIRETKLVLGTKERNEQLGDEEVKSQFLTRLSVAILSRHVKNGEIVEKQPMGQRELAQLMGMSQSTVSRRINEFLGSSWMSRYTAAVERDEMGELLNGFYRDDGSIEAQDEDEDEEGMGGVLV